MSRLATIGRKLRKPARNARAYLKVTERFRPYLRRRRGSAALAFSMAFGYSLMKVIEPWPLKLIIDNVLLGQPLDWFPFAAGDTGDGQPLDLLYILVIAVIAIAFVTGLVYYWQRLLISKLGIEISAELRSDLYEHLQRLSLTFHDRRKTGDLLVRLTSDIRLIRQAFVTLPVELVEGLLLMGAMTVVMLFMDWQLALVALALLPMFAVIVKRYQRPMKRTIRKQREHEGQLATLASEALGAIKVVQAFRRERYEVRRFGGANKQDLRSGVKAARYEAKMKWASELAVAFGTAAIILLASRRILQGSLSPGDLIVFIAYLRIYARPLRRISRITERMARSTAAGERVLDILKTKPTIRNSSNAIDAPRFQGDIVFEGASVAYRSGKPVLQDIDLHIKPGERVAIIGPTGSGKSTLVSLIPRFYDPAEGRVLIDGKDIRDYTLYSLRKQISIVFQEPILFAATIAENIAYGKPKATMEEIERAARRARVDQVIEHLHDGYDTVIGERGGTLSGGQRQCVAIARAMIRNTPIVILDELTTGLDPKSAALVGKAVERLMRDRTVLMISHDMNSIRDVDRVIVLKRGRLVSQGAYGDVIADGNAIPLFGETQSVRSVG